MFLYLIVDLFVSTATTRRRRYHTLQHTFTRPRGLLFATQFVQINLVIMSRAAFEDICLKGLVQPDAGFAGYSLGELFALASVADIVPIPLLLILCFIAV